LGADGERSELRAEGSTVDDSVVPTYSVSFRLQRTTSEFTFVNVPVTADLIIQQPDGTGRIDVSRMVQRAIELGEASSVTWRVEEQAIRPHPIQTPPPGLTETAFDYGPDRG
jgi:hypothetical protein